MDETVRWIYRIEYKLFDSITDAFNYVNSDGFPTINSRPIDHKINDFITSHRVEKINERR